MKKKAVMILMAAVLCFTSTAGPVCYAAAEESAQAQEETDVREDGEDDDKSFLEQGAEIGSDLYEKMDEAVENVDKVSLRREIREALEEMDRIGISPSAIAKNVFGIEAASGKNTKSGNTAGDKLLEDAQKTVKKKTEGFFSMLWDGFLDTLGNIISTGISVFGSQKGNSAKGGAGL